MFKLFFCTFLWDVAVKTKQTRLVESGALGFSLLWWEACGSFVVYLGVHRRHLRCCESDGDKWGRPKTHTQRQQHENLQWVTARQKNVSFILRLRGASLRRSRLRIGCSTVRYQNNKLWDVKLCLCFLIGWINPTSCILNADLEGKLSRCAASRSLWQLR